MIKKYRPLLAVSLVAGALAGCAPMEVKDISADRAGYLTKNFTPTLLTADVGKTVAETRIAPRFGKMIIEYKLESENNLGEKRVTETAVMQHEDLGNGVIREQAEFFNNAIPVSTSFELRYGGLLPLRTQRAINAYRFGNMILEAKQFKTFDKGFANMQENSKYEATWTSGTSVQIVNFSDRKETCTTGKAYPANTVNPAFAGNAVDVDCELYFNGNLDARSQFIFLQHYGLAVVRSSTSNTAKVKAVISTVRFQ